MAPAIASTMLRVRPDAGDVVLYRFLWSSDNDRGHGVDRPRPCVVLHAADVDGACELVLLPITHSVQKDPAFGLDVPREARALMGLDARPSYVVLNEANTLVWPWAGKMLVGNVPLPLLGKVQRLVAELQQKKRLNLTEIGEHQPEDRRLRWRR